MHYVFLLMLVPTIGIMYFGIYKLLQKENEYIKREEFQEWSDRQW